MDLLIYEIFVPVGHSNDDPSVTEHISVAMVSLSVARLSQEEPSVRTLSVEGRIQDVPRDMSVAS